MTLTLFGWRLTNERHAAVPMCGHAEQQYRFDDGWVWQSTISAGDLARDIPNHLMRRECLLVQGHGPGHIWGLWRKT